MWPKNGQSNQAYPVLHIGHIVYKIVVVLEAGKNTILPYNEDIACLDFL